ncbi:unnamed protein product, partial [Oppiella nova]
IQLCKDSVIDAITYTKDLDMYFFTSHGYYWYIAGGTFPPGESCSSAKTSDSLIHTNEKVIWVSEVVTGKHMFMGYDVTAGRWKGPAQSYESDKCFQQATPMFVDSDPLDAMFSVEPLKIYLYAYISMSSTITSSAVGLRTTQQKQDRNIAKRCGFIVATDCLCWMPIVVIKVLALAGVPINDSLYAVIAIFLLPVNSALNPVLYTLTTKLFKQHFSKIMTYSLRLHRNGSTGTGGDQHSGTSYSTIITHSRNTCKRSVLTICSEITSDLRNTFNGIPLVVTDRHGSRTDGQSAKYYDSEPPDICFDANQDNEFFGFRSTQTDRQFPMSPMASARPLSRHTSLHISDYGIRKQKTYRRDRQTTAKHINETHLDHRIHDKIAGLYIDESNRIRIIDPELSDKTIELKNESTEFTEKTQQFQKIVDNFVTIIQDLAQRVEKEKIKAVGSRNLLKSFEKRHNSDVQQLQTLIKEKKQELERLRVQMDSLKREEAEQLDLIEQIMVQK